MTIEVPRWRGMKVWILIVVLTIKKSISGTLTIFAVFESDKQHNDL